MVHSAFFNVGHGEAIILRIFGNDETHWIIRDFGRSRYAKDTKSSVSISCLSQCYARYYSRYPHLNVDAVLSHAHEDHFNGFKALYDHGYSKIFSNAYIPMFKLTDLKSLGGLLIKYSVFLYRYFGPTSLIGQNVTNWLLAAPIMASLSQRLWCVNTGHIVRNWKVENKILWPPKQDGDYDDVITTKLSNRFEDYLRKNNLSEEFLNEESERIRARLSDFYQNTDNNVQEHSFSTEQVATCIDVITESLGPVFHPDFRNQLSPPIHLNNFAYKPTIDNHSLIFEIGHPSRKHLYLSDANDPTIDKMLKTNRLFSVKYDLLKSAHHGTRGAKALHAHAITADEVINCCGPAHPLWHGPHTNYSCIAHRLTCTDWDARSVKWGSQTIFSVSQSCCIRR